MDSIVLRNKVNGALYRNLIKKICFTQDPEKVHNFFIKTGKILGKTELTKKIVSLAYNYNHPSLEQKLKGIKFSNPVGLSAGFDKNAELLDLIGNVGFGFAEVGSITANKCSGNTGKRIERIPSKKSLWINLGLNNNGVDEISRRLRGKNFSIPFGLSIAKTNCRETTDPKVGLNDYIQSLKKARGLGNFFVLNISCPNAYGGQPFSDPKLFEELAREVSNLKLNKPVFVKLSPDLSYKTIDEIISISYRYGISGFICTNLTKKHDFGKGGLSGKVVEERANDLLRYVYKKSKGRFILVGVGGIFSAEDAYKKIKLGANLVELITGMIYQGPNLISEINQGLVELMKKDGYTNISQAIGKSA